MQNDAAEEIHAKKNALTALKCYDNPLEYILDTRRSGMQNDAAIFFCPYFIPFEARAPSTTWSSPSFLRLPPAISGCHGESLNASRLVLKILKAQTGTPHKTPQK